MLIWGLCGPGFGHFSPFLMPKSDSLVSKTLHMFTDIQSSYNIAQNTVVNVSYILDTFFSAKNRQIILMHTPFCWYGSHLCTYVCFREFKKKFRAVQRHKSADGAWVKF